MSEALTYLGKSSKVSSRFCFVLYGDFSAHSFDFRADSYDFPWINNVISIMDYV